MVIQDRLHALLNYIALSSISHQLPLTYRKEEEKIGQPTAGDFSPLLASAVCNYAISHRFVMPIVPSHESKPSNNASLVSLIPPWEDQREWHRTTRMTRPDCAVMCNLINTHTHTHSPPLKMAYKKTLSCNFLDVRFAPPRPAPQPNSSFGFRC